jgi:hypothetical protein
MKLSLFRGRTLVTPPVEQGWIEIPFGFSMYEARVISYSTIFIFLFVNIGTIYGLGSEYFNGLKYLFSEFGEIFTIVGVIIVSILYHFIHEYVHLLFFPDKGLSHKSHVGFMSIGLFTLYNGEFSRTSMQKSLLAPLFALFPIMLIPSFFHVGIILINLMIIHVTACLGDIVLYQKLSKRPDIDYFWSLGTSCWVKFKHNN